MDNLNIKLTLSYDGTEYSGFQSQYNAHTIEDELKLAVKKITGENVSINCAGRTDTGVHAEEQVINFFSSQKKMKENNWIRAMNTVLPSDIKIIKCEFVDEYFHARRSAIYREYWYNIINSQTISALMQRYASHFLYLDINIDLMNAYGKVLTGENDFTSFCSSNDTSKSKRRYIHSINVIRENDLVTIKIIANAFLHHMVRVIVGTMLFLHKTNQNPQKMKEILLAKNRRFAGPTYISKGLVLKKVYYDETILKKEYKVF